MAKVPKKQRINNFTLISADYQSIVIGGLKRSFSRGPVVRGLLKKHRREEDWFKKDGTKAKKKHVFYKCAKCDKEFNSTQIQVDHIEPVVPLNIPAKHMSMSDFIKRLYVEEDMLQILCKTHHKEKSEQENAIRKEWIVKTKYIVYQTLNRLNHKSYIGVHKCEDYDDGYIGSGTLLKLAIEKYGAKSFYRYVLYAFDSPEEAYAKEKELVTEEWIGSECNYNVNLGGIGNTQDAACSNHKRVICHQTGEIFTSVGEAAASLSISASSISKCLNNPNLHIKNLHFFTTDIYDPNVNVKFPISKSKRRIVHLNSKTVYSSIVEAAHELKLNYESLRNALIAKTSDNIYSLDGHYFLYDFEYDQNITITIVNRVILCIELNKTFKSCKEAAMFLKHKNPNHGAIAIGRAARNEAKMYKYTWKYVETKHYL